jgi:hypothetical protein
VHQLRKDACATESSAASATEAGRLVLPLSFRLNRRSDARATRREAHRFRRGCKPATASSRSTSSVLREGPPLHGKVFEPRRASQHCSGVRENTEKSQSPRHFWRWRPFRAWPERWRAIRSTVRKSTRAAEVEALSVNAAAKTTSRPGIWNVCPADAPLPSGSW